MALQLKSPCYTSTEAVGGQVPQSADTRAHDQRANGSASTGTTTASTNVEVTTTPTYPWTRTIDEFVAVYPPRSDNLTEYIAAVAIRFGIPESDLSTYLRLRIRNGRVIAQATMERAMYVKAQEAAELVGVRISKAFAVIDDGMNAEKCSFDKEGNPHFTPDHRTRIQAASKLLDVLGAAHPSKAVVEHEIGDKLAALSTDELKVRLLELVTQAGGTLKASGVKAALELPSSTPNHTVSD